MDTLISNADLEQTGEVAILKHFINSGHIVFDVGANIGAWTQTVFNQHPQVQLHLFEPVPQTYHSLLQNLATAIQTGSVFPNQTAVAHQEELRTFYYYPESPAWSTFHRRLEVEKQYALSPPQAFPILTSTLDQYCTRLQIPRIHFLKIDVEGGELEVLQGAQRLLRQGKIDYLQFEYGGTFLDAHTTLKQVFEYLQAYRYELCKIHSQGLEYRPQFLPHHEDFQYSNFLAINERFRTRLLGQPPNMLDLRQLSKQHSIVLTGIIHIGAHEGLELQTYQQLGASKVLFVEANPTVFKRLQTHIAGIPNVQAVNCAISNQNGTVTLHVTSADQSSSILPLKQHKQLYPTIQETHQITVPSRTLDTLLQELQLPPWEFNFLNIDIQGAELLALQGATQCLKYVAAINTEVNYAELYEGSALIDQLDDFLDQQGFTRVATTTPYHPAWGDAFYVKKPVIIMSTLGQNGRFANQLFQYAFLKIYAKQHLLRVETPPWIGQLLFGHNDPPIFSQPLPLVQDPTHTRYELAEALLPRTVNSPPPPYQNVDFWGYFQYHTRYYAPHKDYFRALFQPVPELYRYLQNILTVLRNKGRTLVGLHLRRGDYGYEHFFIAPTRWYKDWLAGLWTTLDQPILFIASDETDKVVGDFAEYQPITLKTLGIHLPQAEFYPDFYILSQCDLVAISNSSFSFAACMLNERGKYFFRPHLPTQKLIPFDPWHSEVIFQDAKVVPEVNSRFL